MTTGADRYAAIRNSNATTSNGNSNTGPTSDTSARISIGAQALQNMKVRLEEVREEVLELLGAEARPGENEQTELEIFRLRERVTASSP